MPLIVEDGTLPAGANAAVSVAEVDQFSADNPMTEGVPAWLLAAMGTKEAGIRTATRYLAGMRYKGTARGRLAFPRSGCSETGGPTIGESEIPWRYQEAACMLALKAVSGPLLEDTDTGIRSVKAGAVSVEFEPGHGLTTSYTEAETLLAPLLRADYALDAAPIFVPASKPTAFDY